MCSFLWLSNTPLCICSTLLYPFIVNGHLGCFPVLVIVNHAAMNNGTHVSLSILVSSDICLGVGLLGHMVVLFLAF